MFGYIKICKPELKVKEYEVYRAVYCSLCKTLGKSYGLLPRLMLNYDFTFLALLNLSMRDGCEGFKAGRCAFNPLKKCSYCNDVAALDMPAAAAVIMTYYKIDDNVNDEHGIKRLGFVLLKFLYSSHFKKAAKKYPVIKEICSEYVGAQKQLEKLGCENLDEAADPTSMALDRIFSLCSEDDSQKRVLSRLGYCMGRYIYLLDAACDLPRDMEKSEYNVMKKDAAQSGMKPSDFAKKRITPQLYFCSNEAAKAFELLDIKKYKTVLGNIIYLGLEDTFTKEFNK